MGPKIYPTEKDTKPMFDQMTIKQIEEWSTKNTPTQESIAAYWRKMLEASAKIKPR